MCHLVGLVALTWQPQTKLAKELVMEAAPSPLQPCKCLLCPTCPGSLDMWKCVHSI